jgi:plasmid stabilization system protein ParE
MKVELTKRGREALIEALAFLIEQGAPYEVAERTRDEILTAMEGLAEFPRMGKLEERLVQEPEEYRSIRVSGYYRMVYYIEGNTLYVTDIMDTRQNPNDIQS